MSDWCILRTSGRHTLVLAQTLADDGFEVWTPVETRTISVPRMNAKRQVRLPIMPSYVFARAVHLVDLLRMAEMPVKPRRVKPQEGDENRSPSHSDFSVMHAFDGIPMVADRHLVELRKIENKLTPRPRAAYSFPRNASARVQGGVFGGLTGVVVRSSPDTTVLRFGGSFPVEIPTSMLSQDDVCAENISALKAA